MDEDLAFDRLYEQIDADLDVYSFNRCQPASQEPAPPATKARSRSQSRATSRESSPPATKSRSKSRGRREPGAPATKSRSRSRGVRNSENGIESSPSHKPISVDESFVDELFVAELFADDETTTGRDLADGKLLESPEPFPSQGIEIAMSVRDPSANKLNAEVKEPGCSTDSDGQVSEPSSRSRMTKPESLRDERQGSSRNLMAREKRSTPSMQNAGSLRDFSGRLRAMKIGKSRSARDLMMDEDNISPPNGPSTRTSLARTGSLRDVLGMRMTTALSKGRSGSANYGWEEESGRGPSEPSKGSSGSSLVKAASMRDVLGLRTALNKSRSVGMDMGRRMALNKGKSGSSYGFMEDGSGIFLLNQDRSSSAQDLTDEDEEKERSTSDLMGSINDLNLMGSISDLNLMDEDIGRHPSPLKALSRSPNKEKSSSADDTMNKEGSISAGDLMDEDSDRLSTRSTRSKLSSGPCLIKSATSRAKLITSATSQDVPGRRMTLKKGRSDRTLDLSDNHDKTSKPVLVDVGGSTGKGLKNSNSFADMRPGRRTSRSRSVAREALDVDSKASKSTLAGAGGSRRDGMKKPKRSNSSSDLYSDLYSRRRPALKKSDDDAMTSRSRSRSRLKNLDDLNGEEPSSSGGKDERKLRKASSLRDVSSSNVGDISEDENKLSRSATEQPNSEIIEQLEVKISLYREEFERVHKEKKLLAKTKDVEIESYKIQSLALRKQLKIWDTENQKLKAAVEEGPNKSFELQGLKEENARLNAGLKKTVDEASAAVKEREASIDRLLKEMEALRSEILKAHSVFDAALYKNKVILETMDHNKDKYAHKVSELQQRLNCKK